MCICVCIYIYIYICVGPDAPLLPLQAPGPDGLARAALMRLEPRRDPPRGGPVLYHITLCYIILYYKYYTVLYL